MAITVAQLWIDENDNYVVDEDDKFIIIGFTTIDEDLVDHIKRLDDIDIYKFEDMFVVKLGDISIEKFNDVFVKKLPDINVGKK